MEDREIEELKAAVEQETRREIALKMQADRMTPEMIQKYTGIRLEEEQREVSEYDLAARQVAAEMLMRGVPLDSIAVCTRLPYAVLRELKSQLPF